VLAGLVVSCAVGPDFSRPPAPAVTRYTSDADPVETAPAQGVPQHFHPGAECAADWWRLFKSPPLQAIVGEALLHNPGLEAARASLRQSEDSLRSGYGIFYPQVALDASATRQRYAPARIGLSTPGSLFNLFTLSATASYALDVFGGQRRAIESLRSQVDMQRATERGTYLTLIANIVNTTVAAAAYRAEVAATSDLIDLESQEVRLAEVQATAGTVPYSTVLSLKSQLASLRATIPQLQQKLAQSEDLLASLSGHVPAEWRAPPLSLADFALPAELPVSLPSALVRQRPDILIAESTAHAASANVGVATAALLPKLNLSGTYSASGMTTGTTFAQGGRSWSLGADVAQPLFAGGTLWFRRKAAIDSYQQATALYRQTVLNAFAQVADVLRALDHDAATLAAQDEALQTAADALHLVHTNYEAGLNNYLDVLNADAQYHQAMIADLEATAARLQDTVALYVALGGGWWSTPEEHAGEARLSDTSSPSRY